MPGLLLEPPANAGHPGERPRPQASEQTSRHLISLGRPDPRSALATAGLAAAAIGLLGTDGGIVWVVAGVWTVRSMAGTPLGFAWGVACLGAAFRWGTLSLGDLEVATRLVGSTLTSGSVGVRIGMIAAVLGALAGEAQVGGFVARPWGERAAAALAIAALPPLFVASGPGDAAWADALRWALPAVAATGIVMLAQPYASRLPSFVPAAIAAAGTVAALALS